MWNVCAHARVCMYIYGQKSLWKFSPRNVYFWNIMIEIWCYHNFLEVEIQGLTKSCWNLPKRPLFIQSHKMYFTPDTCQVSGYVSFFTVNWVSPGITKQASVHRAHLLGRGQRVLSIAAAWGNHRSPEGPRPWTCYDLFLDLTNQMTSSSDRVGWMGGPRRKIHLFSVLLNGDRIFCLLSWSRNRGQHCILETLIQSFGWRE